MCFQGILFYKRHVNKSKVRHKLQYNSTGCTGRLQHLTFINGQINQTKISTNKPCNNLYYRPNGPSRAFHHTAVEYTFCSSVHGTFSGIDHILGHKTSLNKLKTIASISQIFSDHSGMKLGINNKKILDIMQIPWTEQRTPK